MVGLVATAYHHARSSVRRWGGTVDDYMPIHEWFDETKNSMPDFRHRALRHHAEGIDLMEQVFGYAITISTGPVIPTRWIGEQHVREDFGRIPIAADFLRCLQPQAWMQVGAQKLSEEQDDGQTGTG